MRAKDIMTSPVVTVTADTYLRQATHVLTSHGFTALPVVDGEGCLAGLVTEADLLGHRTPPDPRSGTPSPPLPGTLVGDVMTTKVITAQPGTHVATLSRLMLDKHLRAIPVLDGDEVTGIVSRRDLLRTIGRDDDIIARDVRHHLAAAGRQPWQVTVTDGVATLTSEGANETERHIATVIASSLPGVTGVRVEETASAH
ncbi:CBS domain-containing protein [Amycolatopsis sp. K13G38]|uniref:CBS domain-containing protein n=1 Tax=Amycolatopsis acididurans TaxID=2724524 RepID=A0ABX1IZG2_9PSEU|nr:CBS domain-containing protein [Amycolatopsis acididurans]NKQ52892.1 CBS domain-containing protein [Amycolatopsis acididurans]